MVVLDLWVLPVLLTCCIEMVQGWRHWLCYQTKKDGYHAPNSSTELFVYIFTLSNCCKSEAQTALRTRLADLVVVAAMVHRLELSPVDSRIAVFVHLPDNVLNLRLL